MQGQEAPAHDDREQRALRERHGSLASRLNLTLQQNVLQRSFRLGQPEAHVHGAVHPERSRQLGTGVGFRLNPT